MSQLDSLAYLTDDLPGIGGRIKVRDDDFLVEEQPLFEPAGSGEHLFLFVEKTGRTTTDVVRSLAKAFRISRRDIGYAGLKDKRAVTRQHMTVHYPDPAGEAEALKRLEGSNTLKILWVDRHARKLKRGQLAGNRFVIRLRDVQPTQVLIAKTVIDRLERIGVANYFGNQRFGFRGNGNVIGGHLLTCNWQAALDEMLGRSHPHDSMGLAKGRTLYREKDYAAALDVWPRTLRADRQALDALRRGKDAHDALHAVDRAQRTLYVSAWQSAVFNRVLHQRIEQRTFDKLLPGDLAWKHDARAVFAVDEATAALENAPDGRVARHEISPSGPMWGADMIQPTGQVLQMEQDALRHSGVSLEQRSAPGGLSANGSRRPLRVFLRDPDVSGGVDEHGAYIRLAFELPRGAFATVALRELMKTDLERATGPDRSPNTNHNQSANHD